MLPGFALMMGLSWLYFAMDITGSWLGAAFLGVQAAVVALIVRAVHRIGEHILVDRWLWGIAAACAAAAFAGVSFWVTLPAAGVVYALVADGRKGLAVLAALLAAGLGAGLLLATGAPAPAAVAQAPGEVGHASLAALFLSGLKGGLLTFGGAYTAIPFLRGDAVGRGWMSDGQFLDGLALSGVLPAPLIIFSTFVGYVAGGPLGALVMTAGIFLPAFSFSLILYDRLEAVMEHAPLHRALEGLAAGVVGLIAATAVQLAVAAAQRTPQLWPTVAIFAMSTILLYVWKNKLNVMAVILAGGAAGYLAFANKALS
jgi:chromate transporter